MKTRREFSRLCFSLMLALLLNGCGHLFEDNGTHLAFELEAAVKQMRATGATDQLVHYRTLDAPTLGYYVEITPSIQPDWKDKSRWGSYLVVSGKTSGGTSYHNRFVYVPQRFYVTKPDGGETLIALHNNQGRIEIVSVR